MNEYDLHSPEQIQLKLDIAGLGSRFVAAFIDSLLEGILIVFDAFLAGLFYDFLYALLRGIDLDPKLFILAIVLLNGFLVINCYYIFFETIWNGQTPGKRFAKIRVVQPNGASITFLMAFIRNIIRIVDSIPFFYAVGIITMVLNRKGQRLGDLAAGTIVIRDKKEAVPVPLNIQVLETPWANTAKLRLHEITEEDFAALKKFLLRREDMKVEIRLSLEEKLVTFFSKKLGLNLAEVGPHQTFLQQVAALYQQQKG